MRLLTLASLATLSSASSGCWSEVISGRSPGANIVSKGYTHSSSASSAACQAYCETFSNCLAIIYAPGLQCENSFLVTKGFDAMKSAIARKAERVLERLADGSLPVHADEL